MKYADFFDPPDGEQTGYKEGESEIEDEDEDDDEDDESGGDAEMATAEDDDGEDDQPVSNARESEMDSDEEKTVSSFEKKQQKVLTATTCIGHICISRAWVTCYIKYFSFCFL